MLHISGHCGDCHVLHRGLGCDDLLLELLNDVIYILINPMTIENFDCLELKDMQFIDLEKLYGPLTSKDQSKLDSGDENNSKEKETISHVNNNVDDDLSWFNG